MAINLNELQELLDSANTAKENEKEIRKNIERVEKAMAGIQDIVTNMYALLDGGATPKVRKPRATGGPADDEAPYGRKKDGTPKAKPGRTKDDSADAA